MASKNLYIPFRALGLVCDGLEGSNCAPYIYRRGLQTTITTPVDGARSFHCYNMMLKLKSVSKPLPDEWLHSICDTEPRISALAVLDSFTYVAYNKGIVVYDFNRPYALWKVHEDALSLMLIVGNFLVTVSTEEHRVLSFRLPTSFKDKPGKSPDIVTDISLPLDFHVSAICHPQTYVNKILLGSRDGRCMLINLRSRSIVHTFPSFGAGVTVLTPSPVVDVVAVGTEDGRVILHNFKFDESVATYEHEDNEADKAQDASIVAIQAVSFRTDGSETMVSSDKSGNLLLWDLNEKRLLSAALKVHHGGVAVVEFLESEPILVTAGKLDNALKVHIFDGSEGEARLLRCREGHRLPPYKVRFCGRSSNTMVSVGLDRELRLVSTIRDNKNKTFSQSSLSKMGAKARKRKRVQKGVEVGARDPTLAGLLPPVTALATSTSRVRDEDFANIVTAHANREQVYTWQSKSTCAFRYVLKPGPRPGQLKLKFDAMRESLSGKKSKKANKRKVVENRTAMCVDISACGNFAIVGYINGQVHIYNLQSGTHIGAFEELSEVTEKRKNTEYWGYAHNGAVSEVIVDGLSDILLTAGRKDKTIKYWKLRTRTPENKQIVAESEIVQVVICKSSDLIAVACEDFCIYVYDGTSQKLAREFRGHRAPVSDLCFDGEGRRLVSASMDGTVRTWDLVSGMKIDVLRCADTPTSVVVAPKGAFIATTHVNNLAVVLWVDQSKFMTFDDMKKKSNNEMSSIDNAADLPLLQNIVDDEEDDSGTDTTSSDMDDSDDAENEKSEAQALGPDLATFSGKPSTHWTVLANLSAIKERNKPIAPPKKPEKAPFFLPTVKGLEMKFDLEGSKTKKGGTSKGVNAGEDESFGDGELGNSELGKLLCRGEFEKATTLLYSLQPPGVDLELRTIEGHKALHAGVQYFLGQLEQCHEFELTQAHLNVFLGAHGMEIANMKDSKELFAKLAEAQDKSWVNLRQRFDAVISLSGHFAGQV